MSKPDRTIARARKALSHAVAEAADAKAQGCAMRTMRKAQRRERHSRAAYLESLHLGDLLAELEA